MRRRRWRKILWKHSSLPAKKTSPADIRLMAKKFPNTYSVAIFACCREIYRPTKHCGLFVGTQADAEKYYNHIAPIEYVLEATLNNDMKKKKKELEAEKFQQIQAIDEEKIKAKCK